MEKTIKKAGDVEGAGPWLVWVRGRALVDADKNEIVLDPDKAEEPYVVPKSEHHASLLYDLANLRGFELMDPVAFARRHGLLFSGPDAVREGEGRESLWQWRAVGYNLSTAVSLYVALRSAIDGDTASQYVRDHMRDYRDAGLFVGAIPDDDDLLLKYASVQLAGAINSGLDHCKVTLVAAAGLRGRDGKEAGPAGDFRYVYRPTNLIGAAYEQLARLVVSRTEARVCKGCGRWFRPEHGRQWHHSKDCGRNKRQRNFRERRKAG